ncbi:hypothetical protein DPMN_011547 [Dreissena polymorpha]|uniref:Uncharacterized protein n=1 Tax=Dreissena polymorpha TaxID=45954 RepID=A0A9D4N4A4_DREPO|nr:hypothetical protein DPMN_011547 [Dreissena polymorpha]
MHCFRGSFHYGDEPSAKRAQRETRGQKTESGIYIPSIRGFMDDLTLSTSTHVKARWMLKALTDVAL